MPGSGLVLTVPDAAVELHPHAHGHGGLGDGDEAHEARDDRRPQVLQHHLVGVSVAVHHLQEGERALAAISPPWAALCYLYPLLG